jgi:hypothetical protein
LNRPNSDTAVVGNFLLSHQCIVPLAHPPIIAARHRRQLPAFFVPSNSISPIDVFRRLLEDAIFSSQGERLERWP